MAMTAMGISVTTVSTDQQAPLGFIHVEPASAQAGLAASNNAQDSGERTWIYVKNTSGSAFAVGDVCRRADGAEANATLQATTDHPAKVIGVAQHEIKNNNYGFLLRKGQGLALFTAACAVSKGLVTSGALAKVTASNAVTDAVIGHCVVDPGGAGLGEGYFNCNG